MTLGRPLPTIVGDADEQMRRLLREALEASGRFEVVAESADGLEVVRLTSQLQPAVVVLDRDVPGLDGLSALPRVRGACLGEVIIMVTRLRGPAAADGTADAGEGSRSADRAERLVVDLLAMLEGAVPVADEDAAQWRLPAEPESGGVARQHMRELLEDWRLSEVVDEAELLATELVSNAVVHGDSPVLITARRRRGVFRVEVTDIGEGLPERSEAALTDSSGRGLMLVDALSTAWGTAINGTAKTVWFELAPS